MTRGAVVGIDLGTTFSVVATLSGRRPIVLENVLGERLTPSAVGVDEDGVVLVGAAARARATTHPSATALGFKRDMGTDRVYRLGHHSFRPEELSALVLAELKRDAEAALGRPVAEAVVTVPAYFGEPQRRATRDACAIAGLHVERIVNEPTAAALAYGLDHGGEDLRAIVIDLGGGTLDVTVLQIQEGVIEVQATAGDSRLGGEDFTQALASLLARRIERAHGIRATEDVRDWARLVEAAEDAKRRLSDADVARVALPQLGGARARDVELEVVRADLDEIWRPLHARVRAPIHRALADARSSAGDVQAVLLVGGATRMPTFVELVASTFGRTPLRDLPPDEAVALGAAVQAALKADDEAVADLVSTDIAPFSLGLDTTETLGERMVSGVFTPILERGTVLPASRVERFTTVTDDQTTIRVRVYQGEHALCHDNVQLGELQVTIPKAKRGVESVDVRFTYDMNGILEVDATVVSTKKTTTTVIERAGARLSPAQLAAARKAMAALKVHPRELLPNVTVMRRADALFVELTGDARAALQRGIARMRLALETQDRSQIEVARRDLAQLVDVLRPRR